MKFRVANWVVLILCAMLAAGIMVLCWFEYENELMLWLLGISAILSLPVCSLLHELGHMLFGGFSKIHAKINWSSIFVFFKPSSCEIIPRTDKGIKKRLIATAAGGLAVNFIFIIFGAIALKVGAIPTYLAIVAPASFYLFVMNVMPYETGSGKTDGLVIADILKDDDSAKVMLAVLTVQAQVLGGKPIAEVDENLLFDLPQIQEDDPAFISLTELRAEYFAAKGDTEQAQKYKSRFEQLKEDYLS